jgi:hypothetical protein
LAEHALAELIRLRVLLLRRETRQRTSFRRGTRRDPRADRIHEMKPRGLSHRTGKISAIAARDMSPESLKH